MIDSEMWKSVGIVSGTVLAVWGGIITVIKIQVKTKINDIEEKYKSFISEKVYEIEKIASENEHKVEKMVDKFKNDQVVFRQEINRTMDSYMSSMKKMFEESSMSYERISHKLNTTLVSLDGKVNALRLDFNNVEDKINEMDVSKTVKKEFVDQMNRVLMNAVSYMPEELKPFAVFKGRKFINFVMDIRQLDFNKITDTKFIIDQGISITEEIRREGKSLVDHHFLEDYYCSHSSRTEDFLKSITCIIKEHNNDKKFRFQNECLSFMNNFLQIMDKCYDRYKNDLYC